MLVAGKVEETSTKRKASTIRKLDRFASRHEAQRVLVVVQTENKKKERTPSKDSL